MLTGTELSQLGQMDTSYHPDPRQAVTNTRLIRMESQVLTGHHTRDADVSNQNWRMLEITVTPKPHILDNYQCHMAGFYDIFSHIKCLKKGKVKPQIYY